VFCHSSPKIIILTIDISGGKLSREGVNVRDAIENVEEGFRQPEEVAERVEPEVDELSSQLDNLKRKKMILKQLLLFSKYVELFIFCKNEWVLITFSFDSV
jgi:hypothetical protein